MKTSSFFIPRIFTSEGQDEALVKTWSRDLPAGLAVFLVAVPLCLGIAHASGAPLISGLVSGVLGGLVVGWLSGSHLSVSGPAAGLTTIVLAGVTSLGSFRAFLTATMVAGVIQFILGKMRAGTVNRLFPSPVIKGMLCAIGLILITKQFPHMLGYDVEAFGVEEFSETVQDLMSNGVQPEHNTVDLISHAVKLFEPGALIIGLVSLAILLLWDRFGYKRFPSIPGSLVAVAGGVALNAALPAAIRLGASHLVQIPELSGGAFNFPDLAALGNPRVYLVAITVALVASIETLLCVEAMDRLDPLSRRTPPNRELLAQGAGNFLAGLLGGLPITAVIVRGSVNLSAGAVTKTSAIFHGFLIMTAILFLRTWINLVPLATLAAILVQVGARLASPVNLRNMLRRGPSQSVPFIVTTVAVLLTDLLLGIAVGLFVAAGFIMQSLYRSRGFHIERHGRLFRLVFEKEVTFFHKARLADALESVPDDSRVEIDGTRTRFVDRDVLDTLEQFRKRAATRNIEFVVGGLEMMDSHTPEHLQFLEAEYNRVLARNQEAPIVTPPAETPIFLFIGCSDSHVAAESIVRTEAGRLLVHRNVGNIVSPHDVNLMSVLQYSVEVLAIPHIVVCGHYGCQGVHAAASARSLGLIDNWIQPIKTTALMYREELAGLDETARERRLTELHVIQQVLNLQKSAVVQNSARKLGTPRVHGWVFDPETGLINDLKLAELNPVFQYED